MAEEVIVTRTGILAALVVSCVVFTLIYCLLFECRDALSLPLFSILHKSRLMKGLFVAAHTAERLPRIVCDSSPRGSHTLSVRTQISLSCVRHRANSRRLNEGVQESHILVGSKPRRFSSSQSSLDDFGSGLRTLFNDVSARIALRNGGHGARSSLTRKIAAAI